MSWPLQEAAAICRDSRRLQTVLRLHGIPSQIVGADSNTGISCKDKDSFLRKYKVQLYQFHLLLLERMDGTGVWLNHQIHSQEQETYESIPFSLEDLEHRRVVQLAIRTIYSLGLEYGSVMIGVNSPTKMTILEVLPDFYSKKEIEKLGFEKVEEYQRLWDSAPALGQVMLGADPEFGLRDHDGKIGIASRYLEKQGVIGYDSARLREFMAHSLHPIVEIRPEPSYSPREVFRHILQAMRVGLKKIPSNLEWIAGGMPFFGYPIGGHLHFSGVRLSFPLLRCLDTYLALPLALIEDESCKRRRVRYGFLGDFREQPYGGFEYRTLPSWLVSPLITQGVLALAKVVATHHKQLVQQGLPLPLNLSLQKAYYQGDKEKLRRTVLPLWENLRKLSTYRDYQIELDAFYQYLLTKEAWKSDEDIRLAWGLITHSTTLPKRAIIQNEKMPSR